MFIRLYPHPQLFAYGGVHHFVILHVFTFLVPYCDIRYDPRTKTMFGPSLSPVVCRRAHFILCHNVNAYIVNSGLVGKAVIIFTDNKYETFRNGIVIPAYYHACF